MEPGMCILHCLQTWPAYSLPTFSHAPPTPPSLQTLQWPLQTSIGRGEVLPIEVFDHQTIGKNRQVVGRLRVWWGCYSCFVITVSVSSTSLLTCTVTLHHTTWCCTVCVWCVNVLFTLCRLLGRTSLSLSEVVNKKKVSSTLKLKGKKGEDVGVSLNTCAHCCMLISVMLRLQYASLFWAV